MKIITIILFIPLCFTCKHENKKSIFFTNSSNYDSKVDSNQNYFNQKEAYQKIAYDAVIKNDPESYDSARDFFMLSPDNIELLFFSLTMAYKNNYAESYYDAFSFMNILYEESDSNSLINYFRLYNFAKAYELGYEGTKYGIEFIKDKNGKILPSDFFLDKMKSTH